MLRAIIIQLWNKKRANIFVIIELLCVFCLVWYITNFLFGYLYNCSIPDYRDTKHTWQVKLAQVSAAHPTYLEAENEPEALLANFNRILRTIGNYSGVEAVAVAGNTSSPDGIGYMGFGSHPVADTANIIWGQRVDFSPTEDFFRVFGYSQNEGRKAVSVQDFDWGDPNAIVISRSIEKVFFPNGNAVGQTLQILTDARNQLKVVGVVDDIKRFNYERPQATYYLLMRITANNIGLLWQATISIRSKASISDRVFYDAFVKEMESALQIGNFFLEDVLSYETIKKDTDRMFGVTNQVRIRIYLMVFFLLNILLCVTGTFWYRISVRRGEIGLRKALGSSGRNILNLFLIEGLCLLVVAAFGAMVVELQFVGAGVVEGWDRFGNGRLSPIIYLPDRTVPCFLITNAITAGIMAIVILSAIWIPARRAAAVPPVEALRDE